MFNLGDVFQLVVDCLDYRSLAKQYSVIHRPDAAFHVVLQLGDQLYSVNEKFDEQVFTYIPLIPDKFAIDKFNKRLHFQRFPIIDITRRNHEVQYFPSVVAYKMQLESIEPPQRTFSSCCYALEYLVHVDALVTAHSQQGAVHEADACAFTQKTFLYKDDKLQDYRFLQLSKTVV